MNTPHPLRHAIPEITKRTYEDIPRFEQVPPMFPKIYKREPPPVMPSTDPKFGYQLKYRLIDKDFNDYGGFPDKVSMYSTVTESLPYKQYQYYDIDMPDIIHKMDFMKYHQQMFEG